MKLPLELIHRVQYDYAASKFKSGSMVFNSVDDETVDIVVKSLFAWAEEKGYIIDDKLDFTAFTTE